MRLLTVTVTVTVTGESLRESAQLPVEDYELEEVPLKSLRVLNHLSSNGIRLSHSP